MSKTLFVLSSVEDFAPGAFENTAMEDGSVQLGRSGMVYLPSGCYTSPAFRPAAFLRLMSSWSADTPVGTAVEVQVRVAADGQWSRWFSFGKWSPFIERASLAPQGDEMAWMEKNILAVDERRAPADTVQMRIYLYSEDPNRTPQVRQLGVTVDPVRAEELPPERCERRLEIPRYSCLVRDPSIASRIHSATALAMLMNRWGEDVLPEEVARAGYDFGAGSFNNLSFVAAVAGAYGYLCHLRFAGLELLRKEVRQGRAVGVQVRYRKQIIPDEDMSAEELAKTASLPVLESAALDSAGHLVVLRGFETDAQGEWVVINDPLAYSDEEVVRRLPLKTFMDIFTGVVLVLHIGVKGAGSAKPARVVAELTVEQQELKLMRHGKVLFPGQISLDEVGGITVCYTMPESIAFASAAQKKFYYLNLNEKGAFGFDRASAADKKISFYLIGSFGRTWVAEKRILPPPQQEAEPTTGSDTEQ